MKEEDWKEFLKAKTVKGLLEILKDVRINKMSKTPEELQILIEEISKRHLWETDKIEFEYLRDMPIEPIVEVENDTEKKVYSSIDNQLEESSHSRVDYNSNVTIKYPALITLKAILNIFSWVILIICFLGFFALASKEGMFLPGVALFLTGGLLFLLIQAYINMIQIMVDIENNTRKMKNELCRNSLKK